MIGAPFNDGNGNGSGHTRIYRWNGTQWNQVGEDVDGEAAGDGFGKSIAYSADGTTVAVGVPHVLGDGNTQFSRTQIYRWVGDAWWPLGGAIEGEADLDRSGWAVSLSADGNTLAIGAPYNDGNGNGSGHTRIYRWGGVAWQQMGIDLDGEVAGDESGWSVSLSPDGTTVAIGAPNHEGEGDIDFAGQTRVYRWDGGTRQQLGSDIDGEILSGYAGWSVALSANGNNLAVGAPGEKESFFGTALTDGGHARVYHWDGLAWQSVGNEFDGRPLWVGAGRAVALAADGGSLAIAGSEDFGQPFDAQSREISHFL